MLWFILLLLVAGGIVAAIVVSRRDRARPSPTPASPKPPFPDTGGHPQTAPPGSRDDRAAKGQP